MSEPVESEPLLRLFAYKRFWDVFAPGKDDRGADEPSIAVKAEWLTNLLANWSMIAPRLMDMEVDLKTGRVDEKPSQNGHSHTLELLLESLKYAADSLLAFRRRDHNVVIPEGFPATANMLLARADVLGIRPKDLTIPQIARRLAAASSHLPTGPRPVSIDEQGRVFELTGERLFQFEPEKVLLGRQQIAAGKTYSLDALREAEGRNGR